MMPDALVAAYDTALFDLDGVVYLGPEVVDGAPEAVAALRKRGVRTGFVTNNAARRPESVAEHLTELGIPARATDIVTAAQAGGRLLASRVEPGAPVLVVGTDALREEVRRVGLQPAASAADQPAAVIQGYHPELPWPLVDEAAYAIQGGALWVATNTDATRPTERGQVPGAGAQIAALRKAVQVDPLVAGKPNAPLMEETVRRLDATRPIFVGDRLDTDIDGASAVGMDSLFVFTGAHGKHDLVAASNLPTHLGSDLRALLAPPRVPEVTGDHARLGEAEVRAAQGRIRLGRVGSDREAQLDVLRCVLALLARDRGLDSGAALDALSEVR